jgi:hypothetical protein
MASSLSAEVIFKTLSGMPMGETLRFILAYGTIRKPVLDAPKPIAVENRSQDLFGVY